MTDEAEIIRKLKESILQFEAENARIWATKAVAEGVDPAKAANALTEAIREVGEAFGRGDIFLPELVSAADAMKQAMPVIEEGLKKAGKKRKTLGTLVIGTVEGDIHDIGKAIVAALFEASGFQVIDLGINVPAKAFVDAVKLHKPDLIGLSALLTTTAPQQKVVINSLQEAGLRNKVKVIVGGGAITQDFADRIGADGYGANAVEGVQVAVQLLETK